MWKSLNLHKTVLFGDFCLETRLSGPGAPDLENIRKYNGSGRVSGVPEPQNGVSGCNLIILIIFIKMLKIPFKKCFWPSFLR